MLTCKGCRFWRVGATGAALTFMVLAGACGGGGSGQSGNVVTTTDGGGKADGPAAPPPPPNFELDTAIACFMGGSAPAAGGVGQAGGTAHLIAKGDVTLDSSQAPVVTAAAVIPAAPGGATTLTSDALASDVSAPGSVVVNADVTSSGATRQISASGGDIFIVGTLRAAGQALTLTASGNVYISGALDTSGAPGQAGGNISITAAGVVVTGRLSSAGGDGDTTGGAAGSITIRTTGDVTLDGHVRVRGGNAVGTGSGAFQGGAAGTLAIDADGHVRIGGTVDGRGGSTSSASGSSMAGGAAGLLKIGEAAPPLDLTLAAPLSVVGGEGDAQGGAGGTVNFEPVTGNINVAGLAAVDATGGPSRAAAGLGGLITGSAKTDPGTGGLHVSGEMSVNGGSIFGGGTANGADAGRVDFQLKPTQGGVVIDATGLISADGGASGGAGIGGGGGHVWIFTKDGDLTLSGAVHTRGGNAPDPGGTGGRGGMVYFFTDNNHDAIHNTFGHLLIAPTGVIDSSGGTGTQGGNARSDGIRFMVPVFPVNQESIAIFLNCDGAHGETLNWLDNQGLLIARGGAHNGNGGDIVYHGISPAVSGQPHSGNSHPPSGKIDIAGDGTGVPGDFLGE